MHGITHQVHGLSGDEYEFWDELGNKPVGGDSAEFVMRRLRMGFAECFANDIYPVAFEVPHYGASEIDYRTLGQVFSLFYDRPMVVPDDTTAQMVPYPVVDQYGRHIVPETLGYLPEDDPDPLKLVQYARTMRVVRDGIASFYFHPFLKQKLLEQVVQGISDFGLPLHFPAGIRRPGRLPRPVCRSYHLRPHPAVAQGRVLAPATLQCRRTSGENRFVGNAIERPRRTPGSGSPRWVGCRRVHEAAARGARARKFLVRTDCANGGIACIR